MVQACTITRQASLQRQCLYDSPRPPSLQAASLKGPGGWTVVAMNVLRLRAVNGLRLRPQPQPQTAAAAGPKPLPWEAGGGRRGEVHATVNARQIERSARSQGLTSHSRVTAIAARRGSSPLRQARRTRRGGRGAARRLGVRARARGATLHGKAAGGALAQQQQTRAAAQRANRAAHRDCHGGGETRSVAHAAAAAAAGADAGGVITRCVRVAASPTATCPCPVAPLRASAAAELPHRSLPYLSRPLLLNNRITHDRALRFVAHARALCLRHLQRAHSWWIRGSRLRRRCARGDRGTRLPEQHQLLPNQGTQPEHTRPGEIDQESGRGEAGGQRAARPRSGSGRGRGAWSGQARGGRGGDGRGGTQPTPADGCRTCTAAPTQQQPEPQPGSEAG
eukprot:363227-Chlamydomonas_euryale.AAC.6